jgi:hypothetical protein
MAGLNPQKKDAFKILSATPISIKFALDRNLDGEVDAVDELMGYSYDEGNKEVDETKGEGEESSSARLIDNVLDLRFTYFNELGEDLEDEPDPDEIRVVEIELTVEQPAGRDRAVERTYSTRVICRNLGLQ